MAWLWVVLVVVVLGFTAAVAVGRGGGMTRAYPDRRDVRLPAGRPVTGADLEGVEFSVVLRGYRMDEVDDVIDRLVDELAARDARLARLESGSPGTRGQYEPSAAGEPDRPTAPPAGDDPAYGPRTDSAGAMPISDHAPSPAAARRGVPPADNPVWRRNSDPAGSYPLYPRTGGNFMPPDPPRPSTDPDDQPSGQPGRAGP
jgi:DivIVA domain-containing protein